MANLNLRRPQNISGEFYVDTTYIDCDTCRWMAPEIFNRTEQQSSVYHQPYNEEERIAALQALLSCPTASIGTVEKPNDIKIAHLSFPIQIEENVYHCGYHSEKSFGAASYFIQLSSGNVLVDSPVFAPPLVKRLEKMGGVRYMYLTHQDDVADHEKFAQHFDCERILHVDEISNGTKNVEIQLDGLQNFELTPDLLIIPVPGHTKGNTVLLYKNRFLFAGDHLAWSDRLGQLIAFRNFCFYSWSELRQSMIKLNNYSFEWVLPGHGRRYHADTKTMHQQIQKCIEWMETV
ncbi:MAG: MBL fold metallo-hydrolase [Cyanobacteria bacterium P01_A01_bin.84]